MDTATGMTEILEIAGVAFTAFVSTNTDNLLLLGVLLGQPGQRRLPVLVGYVVAILAIVIVALLLGRLADTITDGALGYLGLLTLGMGINRLRKTLLASRHEDGGQQITPSTLGYAGAATLMLSNGTDTLGVVTALLADTSTPLDSIIALTMMGAALLWFGIALAIARQPRVSRVLARAERWLVPVLLICVGLYILADTTTDTFVG